MTIILNSINIDSLLKAHDNLKTILTQDVEYNIKRDTSLKRFELAFEMTWKVLKKIVLSLNFQQIIDLEGVLFPDQL